MKGYGQFCPIAMACETFAERWTPLILRELLNGSRRFNEIRQGIPLISRTLLGQRLPGGDRGLRLPDPRLKAGVALSPVPPRGLPPRLAFARVATPMLHVTGTADRGYIEGATPQDRLIPFQAISGPPQALAVLAGANHAAFADERAAGAYWSDSTFHLRTAGLAVAFLHWLIFDVLAPRMQSEAAWHEQTAEAAQALRSRIEGAYASRSRGKGGGGDPIGPPD